MKWLILVVGLVVVCFVAALALGLIRGGGMGASTSSMRHEPLSDSPLSDEDLDGLQFDVTARGYRMGEVDAVIDRLRRELRDKDEQIAVLRRDVARSAAGGPPPTPEDTGAAERTEDAEPPGSAAAGAAERTEAAEPAEPESVGPLGRPEVERPAAAGPAVGSERPGA